MEYTRSVVVPGEPATVAALYTDPSTWPEWQPTLLSVEPLEGASGAPVRRTELRFRRGRSGVMRMLETIEVAELPHRWSATYEAPGVRNACDTRFRPVAGGTELEQRNEFRFSGAMRIVGALFARSFPAETERSLEAFRAFAARRAAG